MDYSVLEKSALAPKERTTEKCGIIEPTQKDNMLPDRDIVVYYGFRLPRHNLQFPGCFGYLCITLHHS